jgi:hypothetical protein
VVLCIRQSIFEVNSVVRTKMTEKAYLEGTHARQSEWNYLWNLHHLAADGDETWLDVATPVLFMQRMVRYELCIINLGFETVPCSIYCMRWFCWNSLATVHVSKLAAPHFPTPNTLPTRTLRCCRGFHSEFELLT